MYILHRSVAGDNIDLWPITIIGALVFRKNQFSFILTSGLRKDNPPRHSRGSSCLSFFCSVNLMALNTPLLSAPVQSVTHTPIIKLLLPVVSALQTSQRKNFSSRRGKAAQGLGKISLTNVSSRSRSFFNCLESYYPLSENWISIHPTHSLGCLNHYQSPKISFC